MIKINGQSISATSLTSIVLIIVWLAGLSFKVDSNAKDIEKAEDTDVKIARIEVKAAQAEKDIGEIKDELKDQGKTLAKIWAVVEKNAQ